MVPAFFVLKMNLIGNKIEDFWQRNGVAGPFRE
jgi:hypothetical protein